jgi:integrase
MTNAVTTPSSSIASTQAAAPWPAVWDHARGQLRQARYRTSTLRVYRHVLRSFASHLDQPPAKATSQDVRRFLTRVSSRSASWLTVNISALRAVFDKVGGFAITTEFRTPKRPDRLPEVLSSSEVERLFRSSHTIRDRLILGLLTDCGLKTGELIALRWGDVGSDGATVHVVSAANVPHDIPVPAPWSGLLAAGKSTFPTDAYVIPGRRPDKPCRGRTIERIVCCAAGRADLPKIVTAMTLRHTHAVACLRAGMSERELQVRLGHASIETTLLYRRLVPVVTPISPLDASPVPLSSPVRPPEPGFRSVIRAGLRLLRSFVSAHMPAAVSHPIPSGP